MKEIQVLDTIRLLYMRVQISHLNNYGIRITVFLKKYDQK